MGILGVYKESITLVNRTSRELNVRYDGEDITLQPGENPGFPQVAVPYAKRQNPLMGSKHPVNPTRYISLVGVKAKPGEKQQDDITPISDETLEAADRELEVIDRSGKYYGRPMRQNVKLLNHGFDMYDAQVGAGALLGDANGGLDGKLG